MRYGRILTPIAASQVETPQAGVNEFLDPDTYELKGKFPDGSVRSLSGSGGGAQFQSQAVNTGTADDLEVAITGVVAYTEGDVYYLYVTEDNTAAMTLDINGLGAKDIKFLGDMDLSVPAGAVKANTVNAFIYHTGRFEWIGMVDTDKVAIEATITAADAFAFAGAVATATMKLLTLPAKSNLNLMVVVPTVDVSGGAITAATVTGTNVESSLNLFGGAVDTFTGAVAGGDGGLCNGLQTNGVIPSFRAGTVQVYQLAWTLTGDTWDNAAAGAINVQAHWTYVPW